MREELGVKQGNQCSLSRIYTRQGDGVCAGHTAPKCTKFMSRAGCQGEMVPFLKGESAKRNLLHAGSDKACARAHVGDRDVHSIGIRSDLRVVGCVVGTAHTHT